jgi:hypothetical protein
MKKKPAADPIVANRQQLIDILLHKSALKQDIADDAERVFEQLRALIDKEIIALKEVITDERVRLWIKDRGDHEFHVYIGSDVLVFNLHHNVFRLPDSNPLWGTAYFKSNPNNGYFGTIHIYNFIGYNRACYNNVLDRCYNAIGSSTKNTCSRCCQKFNNNAGFGYKSRNMVTYTGQT